MMRLSSLGLAGALFLFWSGGCAPPTSRDDLVKQVLKADPEFGAVLEKHRELTNRIQTYERELALKRSTVDQQIKQLRTDLSSTAASVKQKSSEVKSRMAPDRQRLELDLNMASEELQAKRQQRAYLGRTVSQLRKALKSANTAWTGEERANQEAKIEQILNDAKRLDQEMAAIQQHVKLLKIKLLLIRL